jgi:hypothetical protein
MPTKIENNENKINSDIKIWNNKNSQKNILQILSEKSKKVWQLTSKYRKILLLALLLTSWGIVYNYLNENKKDIREKHDKKLNELEIKKNKFRNNPDFFKKWLEVKKERLWEWVNIIRDARLTFYVVTKDDLTQIRTQITKSKWKWKWKKKQIIKINKTNYILDRDKIRHKLSKFSDFKYLEKDEYKNKIKWFNIPKGNIDKERINEIEKWKFFIPVPLESDIRKFEVDEFAKYCKEAIKEMKEDKIYWKRIQERLKLYNWNENQLTIDMIAFARSESTEEYTNFVQPIWSVELHRREEGKYKEFSFTYFHILMEWPWLDARKKLWLTEWQCYNPKNAAKLFLAFWIEKNKWNLKGYFPLSENNIWKTWKRYNWSNAYTPKLKANRAFVSKVINWKVKLYNSE